MPPTEQEANWCQECYDREKAIEKIVAAVIADGDTAVIEGLIWSYYQYLTTKASIEEQNQFLESYSEYAEDE